MDAISFHEIFNLRENMQWSSGLHVFHKVDILIILRKVGSWKDKMANNLVVYSTYMTISIKRIFCNKHSGSKGLSWQWELEKVWEEKMVLNGMGHASKSEFYRL